MDLSCSTECRAQMHLNLYRWIYIYIYVHTYASACVLLDRLSPTLGLLFCFLSLGLRNANRIQHYSFLLLLLLSFEFSAHIKVCV